MSARRMTLRLRKLSARLDPHRVGRQLRLAAGLAILAIPLSGCGTGALWDKFFAKDDTFVEEPADKLYNEGLYLMNHNSDPKAASKKFEEVDRQHPYSEWARKSLLMSAYAYYNSGDYDNCIGAATRYVTLHPGSPDAAYAQFLIASSQYDQIPDTSRDQGRTEKAIAALEEVIRKYPTSEYAVSAKAKLEGARDQLAGKEMNIGRFYLRSGDPMGAIGRFRTVVEKYQTTSHVPEALYRLVETYLTVGLVGEAKRNGAVLGYNYPGDPWYSAAYALLTAKGYKPEVAPTPGGLSGPHFPLFGHHDKSRTLPPPSDTSPAALTPTSDTTAPAAPASNSIAAATTTDAGPAKPVKKTGFLHGFLGL